MQLHDSRSRYGETARNGLYIQVENEYRATAEYSCIRE